MTYSAMHMIGAAFFFALMGVCVRLASASLPVMEIVFFRSILGLAFVSVLMVIRRRSFVGRNPILLILRGLVGFIALSLYFWAISLIPLATAVMLNYTSPLFVAVLAPILLREKFDIRIFLLIMIGFVGVVFIVKPVVEINCYGALIGLVSGLFAAFAYLCVSALKKKHASLTIIFHFMFLSTLLSFPIMVAQFKFPQLHEFVYLLGVAFCATVAQILMTRAYRFGKTASISAYSSMIIVFALILGIVMWLEIPSIWSLMGGCIIISSVFFIAKREKMDIINLSDE